MMRLQCIAILLRNQSRNFTCGYPKYADSSNPKKEESERMKKFHEQLKLEKIPRVGPAERFVDLMMVHTDPVNGELVPNSDKNPTRWGDWQHNGRVTDF